MPSKTERLDREAERLAARLKSLNEERELEQKRDDLRRSEILGKLVLKALNDGSLTTAWLQDLLSKNRVRKAELALFDLTDESEDESALESLSDVEIQRGEPLQGDDDELENLDGLESERTEVSARG